jgi:hypothetical protein
MAELAAVPSAPANPRRALHFEWIIPVLIRPRKAFAEIASYTRGVWLVPILILTLTTLMSTLMNGYVTQKNAATGEVPIDENFFFTPEDEAQIQQAMAAMQSPVFVYFLPAIVSIVVVWGGWLIFGSVLHLILTLLGGRSTMGITMNIMAWASLPLAIRQIVQFFGMLIDQRPISGPGFSGLLAETLAQGGSIPLVIVAAFLALLDIYLIWQVVLLVIGIRASSALSVMRALVSVLIALGILLIIQTGVGYGLSLLSGITVIRPFF